MAAADPAVRGRSDIDPVTFGVLLGRFNAGSHWFSQAARVAPRRALGTRARDPECSLSRPRGLLRVRYDCERVQATFEGLERRARDRLLASGHEVDSIILERFADVRYKGQVSRPDDSALPPPSGITDLSAAIETGFTMRMSLRTRSHCETKR